MKLEHTLRKLVKRYNKDKNPNTQQYRDYIHEVIRTYVNLYNPQEYGNRLCMYLGETDAQLNNKEVYGIFEIEYTLNPKYRIARTMTKDGTRYILLNELGYTFVPIANSIEEATLYNALNFA